MKNSDLKFHIDVKNTLIWMAIFVLIAVFLLVLFALSTSKQWIQLSILEQSKYDYSATIERSVGYDDYYFFQSGAIFIVHPDAEYRINAEILMQTENSDYSTIVSWNAERLGVQDIAISQNIADAYQLNVGDKLYSKHLVSNVFMEYDIKQIVPSVISVHAEQTKYSNGVIIMGFDADYENNIIHKIIIFSASTIAEISEKYNAYPFDIMYRSDDIRIIIKNLLPSIIVIMLLSTFIAFLQSILLKKRLCHNYKRLLMLGYSKRHMDFAWTKTFLLIGICTAFITFLFGAMVMQIIAHGSLALAFIVLITQVAVYCILCRRFMIRIERS